jgi:hypothetical protein
MDLVGFSIFTLGPIAFGMYFAYVFSAIKGMNRALWTIAGGFSILVPLFIFFKSTKENTSHPWFPGESETVTMKSPALLRSNPNKSRADTSGYVYLLENTIRWVPSDNSRGYEWDYAYGLRFKGKRTYKDALLTWMLLPNSDNEANPFALSLGVTSAMEKLNMMTAIRVMKNEDQEILDMVIKDSSFKMFGRKEKNSEEDN